MAKSLNIEKVPLYGACMRFYRDAAGFTSPSTGRRVLPKILAKGSARSSKTWTMVKVITSFCDHNREDPLYVAVLRSQLTLARDYTFKDFIECFSSMGLVEGEDFTAVTSPKPKIKLWGSTIDFYGLTDASAGGKNTRKEAPRSDIVFANEVIENKYRSLIEGWLMRCEMLFLADFNPTLMDHWVYSMAKEENTAFFDVSYLNNPFLNQTIVTNIESKCPWDFKASRVETDQYGLAHRVWLDEDEDARPVNKANRAAGTVDKYWWKVYGEGKAAQVEGAVFNPEYVDEWPGDAGWDAVAWGLDFGYTSAPSALVKVGRRGMGLTVEYKAYQATSDTDTLYDLVMPHLLEYQRGLHEEMKEVDPSAEAPFVIVACDSADKFRDAQFVRELNARVLREGHRVQFLKVKKPHVVVRIALMKRFRMTVVKSIINDSGGFESVTEFTNYKYERVDDKPTNVPVDDFNHGIDALGYAIWHSFRWVVGGT